MKEEKMFKVGEIYNFTGNVSKSIREYVTPDGIVCPDILIEERCIPKKSIESGYYKVLKIKSETETKDALGAIRRYEVEMDLEKVADSEYGRRLRTNRLFKKLKSLGFYLIDKEVENCHPMEHITEWFAVDAKRGITAHGCNDNWKIKDIDIKIYYPSQELLRDLMFQYIQKEYHEKDDWDVCVSINNIGPNLFDILSRQQLDHDKAKDKNPVEFEMPFVKCDIPQAGFWGYSNPFMNQHPNYNEDHRSQSLKEYIMMCRKVFNDFPEEVKSFLQSYTNVDTKYLRGEPWKKYTNGGNLLDEAYPYFGYDEKDNI